MRQSEYSGLQVRPVRNAQGRTMEQAECLAERSVHDGQCLR
jgi:hypothetical protein